MSRRVLIAAAAAAFAAFAPPASAQSVDERSCVEAGGRQSVCRGLDKLGERASAECRRRGIADDETCWSRVGRRVVRAEVDAYRQSWVHDANELQYRLGDSLPLRSAPWLGTHNSANSTSEPPTISATDSNQQLTLTDQLKLGVRSLELDVHHIPSPLRSGEAALVVCHGRPPGEQHVGCTTEATLGERLGEVVRWLELNPDQVLLLYVEDAIENGAGYTAAAGLVKRMLGARLYAPRAAGCNPLPLELTRDAVRAAGAQVIVVGDCGTGAWQGVSHQWKQHAGTTISWESRAHGYDADSQHPCQQLEGQWGPSPATSAASLIRFYEDSTWISTTPAGGTDDGLTPPTVRRMLECGVELLGFDQLLPRDGRLAAAVWTWAGEDSVAGPGDCVAQLGSGRWEAQQCSLKRRPACVDAAGAWTVLATAVKHKNAVRACREDGLTLGTPRTSQENAALRAAAGDAPVWLGYRRS